MKKYSLLHLLFITLIATTLIPTAFESSETIAAPSAMSLGALSNNPLMARALPRLPNKATTDNNNSDDGTPPALPAETIPHKPKQEQAEKKQEDKETLPRLGWSSVSIEINTLLDENQKKLETIFKDLQTANPPPSGLVLNQYNDQISSIRNYTSQALTQIQTYDTAMTSILQVIGDKASIGEDPSITEQRKNVQKISQNIKTTMVRAKLYDLQARQLHSIVETLRNHIEQVTLSKKSLSPVTLKFWSHLIKEYNANYLFSKNETHKQKEHRIFIPIGIILTFLIIIYARTYIHNLIKRFIIPRLFTLQNMQENNPPHEALICLLTGIICAIIGTSLWQLWRIILLSQPYSLIAILSANLPICYFVTGATIPLHHWQKGFLERKSSLLLAIGLLAYATIKFIQSQEIIGPVTNNFLESFYGLYSAISLYFIVKIHCRAIEKNPDNHLNNKEILSSSLWNKILYPLTLCIILVTISAILLGYISFAFLLNGTLLTLSYAFGVTGLLVGAWQQISNLTLSPQYLGGKTLVKIGLSPRRLEQINVVTSAFGCAMLLMVLITLIDNNGDFSLLSLWKHLHTIFIGNNIHGVPLSPETILKAIFIIVGAHYAISFMRHWFSDKLFPTTKLDTGLQTSILSILTYCSWIIVGFAIFTLFGVSVQNLTWVVSALSVGVGFGLQSIVKDFISGIILLAERPVQTGDIIEISGNRGEVRRINVRATDITLDDGSTLIVPNSVFITSNVKNASFDGMPAHLTFDFSLPSETDLEKTRQIILEAVSNTPMILAQPEPQIRITALAGATLTLTLEVCFKRAKDEEDVKDHLLTEIFSSFHKEDMSITVT